jgi:hypothetical protein
MANTRTMSYIRSEPYSRKRCRKKTRKCGAKCVPIRKRPSEKMPRCKHGYIRCPNQKCQERLPRLR